MGPRPSGPPPRPGGPHPPGRLAWDPGAGELRGAQPHHPPRDRRRVAVRRPPARCRGPEQPRPRGLPRDPCRPRVRRRRVGDDLSPRAHRSGPGLHLGVGHRRKTDVAGPARRPPPGVRGGVQGSLASRLSRAERPSRAAVQTGLSRGRGPRMIALHHVQVACPPGGEDDARRFYGDGLGLIEVEKPAALRSRGGAWFREYDIRGAVTAEIHVGVEEPCTPARKAHPAFVVEDLYAIAGSLTAAGFAVDERERDTFQGYRRFHTNDAAGNRVEVLQPVVDFT